MAYNGEEGMPRLRDANGFSDIFDLQKRGSIFSKTLVTQTRPWNVVSRSPHRA
jgi:hypothetical protein